MKIINEEMYKMRIGTNDKINIKDMNIKAKESYFEIYSLYIHLLYQLLQKNTDIIKYDKRLESAGFKVVESSEQDFYQMLSNDFLQYIYIRNNLYIDRLSNEEIEFLGQKIISGNYELDEKAEVFIFETFRKVIFENFFGNFDPNLVVNNGPNSEKFYAPVSALVLGIRYDEQLINDYDKEWLTKYLNDKKIIEQIGKELSESISKKLSIEVVTINYDANSVKKSSLDNDDVTRRW